MDSQDKQPPRLHILTFDPPAPEPDPCSGSYSCQCAHCVTEREERVRRGIQPRRKQPWDTKAA